MGVLSDSVSNGLCLPSLCLDDHYAGRGGRGQGRGKFDRGSNRPSQSANGAKPEADVVDGSSVAVANDASASVDAAGNQPSKNSISGQVSLLVKLHFQSIHVDETLLRFVEVFDSLESS